MWSNQAPDTITIPGGATTGQRTVIDNTGIHLFDVNNNEVITIQPKDTNNNNSPDILIGIPTKAQLRLHDSNGSGIIDVAWPSSFTGGGISLVYPTPILPANVSIIRIESAHNATNDYILTDYVSGSISSGLPAIWRIIAGVGGFTYQPITVDGVNGIVLQQTPVNIRTQIAGTTLAIGNMPAGKNYYEEWGLSAGVTVANNATAAPCTAGLPLVSNFNYSDYSLGSMNLTTGIWTCPGDGVYEISYSLQYVAWVAGSRQVLFAFRNNTAYTSGLIRMDGATNDLTSQGQCRKFFTAGDTVLFKTFQATGAVQTLAVSELSYISIKREF